MEIIGFFNGIVKGIKQLILLSASVFIHITK